MKRLIQTTAFEQLASNDLTAIPIRAVCNNFIEDVIRLSETEKDLQSLFRTLYLYPFPFTNNLRKRWINNRNGGKMYRNCYMSLIRN